MQRKSTLALIALGAAVYAGLSHWLTVHAPHSVWAQATVFGPMCVLGVAGLWGDGQRRSAVGVAVAALALLIACDQGVLAVEWLYLTQHAGVQFALAALFGRTLRPGRQPLISMLAERVHGHLIPSMATYTRGLTAVWTGYFLTVGVLSLLLFTWAPHWLWSLLANVLTPVSLVLMFVVEYVWRYRAHPEFERVPLLEAVRAYQANSRDAAAGGAPAAPAPTTAPAPMPLS